jgi:hypothetical protein
VNQKVNVQLPIVERPRTQAVLLSGPPSGAGAMFPLCATPEEVPADAPLAEPADAPDAPDAPAEPPDDAPEPAPDAAPDVTPEPAEPSAGT